MGTSISHGSPHTLNWSAASMAYRTDSVPIKRAVEEIWLAANHQPEGNIARDLKDPSIRELLEITLHSESREEALNEATWHAAHSKSTSLATEIALRAIVKSFGYKNRSAAFTKYLFTEASNYLVSRDLPEYIGKGGRAKNTQEALNLKDSLLDEVAKKVDSVRRPDGITKQERWISYVNQVVDALSGQHNDNE